MQKQFWTKTSYAIMEINQDKIFVFSISLIKIYIQQVQQ